MKRLLMIGFVILQPAMLAGCNTVAGAGQDMSHAGHEITGEANEHKD